MNSDEKLNAFFLGSKEFGLSIFESIFSLNNNINWTIYYPNLIDEDIDDKGSFLTFSINNGCTFKCTSDPLEIEVDIKKLSPVIGIVCGWYRVLPSGFLNLFPLGLWGIHNSLLPKYRGGSPLVWSIIDGQKNVGSTVFKLTEGVDDGDILTQINIPLEFDDYVSDVLEKLKYELRLVLPNLFRKLLNGERVELTPQNSGMATYCAQRTEFDGEISWKYLALEVYNFIRAQAKPYPGAFFYVNGIKTFVLEAAISSKIIRATPGQVVLRSNGYVYISCGRSTVLELRKLSIDGVAYNASKILTSNLMRLKGSV